jgi:hypothetical protein
MKRSYFFAVSLLFILVLFGELDNVFCSSDNLNDEEDDIVIFDEDVYEIDQENYDYIDIVSFFYNITTNETIFNITMEEIDKSKSFVFYITDIDEFDARDDPETISYYVKLVSDGMLLLGIDDTDDTPQIFFPSIYGNQINFKVNYSLDEDKDYVIISYTKIDDDSYAMDFVPNDIFVDEEEPEELDLTILLLLGGLTAVSLVALTIFLIRYRRNRVKRFMFKEIRRGDLD